MRGRREEGTAITHPRSIAAGQAGGSGGPYESTQELLATPPNLSPNPQPPPTCELREPYFMELPCELVATAPPIV